jgi:chemotaxis protein MotA
LPALLAQGLQNNALIMLVIVGYLIILGAVLGGFALAGGHLGALLQPVELIMIGGSALGAFFVANSGKVIKSTFRALPSVLKGSKYSKALYLELLSLLYDILAKVRKEGLMSVEADVDNPGQSPIFTKYPRILADHHAMEFLTDYLRLMVSGNLNAFEIENLMDVEIETHHHEGETRWVRCRSSPMRCPRSGSWPP